jgi:hypothetical protein
MSNINANANQDLQAFRVASLPPEFYYIPNFITPEEEASILNKVHSVPQFISKEQFPHLDHVALPFYSQFSASTNTSSDSSTAMDTSYSPTLTSASINSHQKQHFACITLT